MPRGAAGLLRRYLRARVAGVVGNADHVPGRRLLDAWHDGDDAALAAYHNGDRSSELVRQYFERGMSLRWPKVA